MKIPIINKQAWTAFLIVLLLLVAAPTTRKILFEDHLFSFVDASATQYVNDGLVRAGSAFALARTFNAIVSVFRESQLQLEPGGVGVSLAVGAALDPVNDLVERFSWVMLVSLTSLGVQKFLIEITPFVSIQIVLSAALLFFLAGFWLTAFFRFDFLRIGRILLFSAILLRFTVPLTAYLNNQVYDTFLETRHDQSINVLGQSVTKLEQHQLGLTPKNASVEGSIEPTTQDGRWLDWLKPALDTSKEMLDVKAKFEKIKVLALEMIDRIVDLIVVFVLSTIVLPLLFLWGMAQLGRLCLGRSFETVVSKGMGGKVEEGSGLNSSTT
jgi:hypothetical protein